MKYIKLFENFNEDIHSICKKYEITNYTINEDGSIDVNGSVDLYNKELTKLPLNFRNITGYFRCSHNQLTSIEGCPVSVGGHFTCSSNKLTSLEGCPESVGGDFYCSYNQLNTLEFCPVSVGRNFNCSYNLLTSLEGSPKSVGSNFHCYDNDIIDFIGFIEPVGDFYCKYNKIYNIWKLFKSVEHVELLNYYDCIRGENIIIDRLNMFLEEIGKDTVESVDGYNNI